MCIEFVLQVAKQKNAHVFSPVGMVILRFCVCAHLSAFACVCAPISGSLKSAFVYVCVCVFVCVCVCVCVCVFLRSFLDGH